MEVQLIDIGVNLTDPMYRGEYNGKQYHPPDLDAVISRAFQVCVASSRSPRSAAQREFNAQENVVKMIITGGSLDESKEALDERLQRLQPSRMGLQTRGAHNAAIRCAPLRRLREGTRTFTALLECIRRGATSSRWTGATAPRI